MHATLEELLALKDGEANASVAQHVGGCDDCQAELERLHQVGTRLRALPVRRPPRDLWPAVRAAVGAERRRRHLRRASWAVLAAAATVVLLLAGGAGDNGVPGVESVASAEALEELVAFSQQLEGALRAMEPESRVLNGRAASAVVELQDRIAWVDAQLGRASAGTPGREEVVDLWRQRVALLDALVNVHVTRATNVGF